MAQERYLPGSKSLRRRYTMSDNYEIDYKAMFEAMQKRLHEAMKADEEYFALLNEVTENTKYGTALAPVILKLPKHEQIKYLRIAVQLAIVAKTLCEKYHLLDEETDESEVPYE